MARKITRKSLKQDDFVEAAFDVGIWLEAHWRRVAAGLATTLALVLLASGWIWWSGRKKAEAGRALGEGLSVYQPSPGEAAQPRVSEALALFESASRAAPTTPAGRVAALYQGAALLKLGRAAEAVTMLEGFVSTEKDEALAEVARAKLASAYAAAGQTDQAVSTWKEIAEKGLGYYPGDLALLQAGEALYRQGKVAEAREIWQDLVARYPQGPVAEEATKLLSKVAGATP